MKKSGFTLVELLVVIIIIAILATIGMTFYTTAQKSARDAKRQTDLRFIQSALEQYFADQFFYPCNISFDSPFTNSTGLCSATVPSSAKTYLNTVPKDPVQGGAKPYAYQSFPTNCDNAFNKCTSYCLYAQMEIASNGSIGCTTYPGVYNFSVTLP